ncbi:MAG: family 78 glycoside hydrolase catalytic domain, partial [Oscillospiraceae bacterium]|nr:family 78 glycoside hydrolase catalytic domain [Oscillospiraceae bacterium]
MNPADLKTQNRKNPIGVGSSIYFSWILESNIKNTKQTFYHLTVYDESQKPVWDTGKILSKQSVYIRYEGQMLSDCSIYNWEVTVWDNHGNEATATAVFETSILQPSRWSAKWVAAMKNKKRAKKGNPASYFRKSFTLRNNPVKARVYATCHGIYYLTLNNLRADDRELAPEFTVYKDYLCVQTYDVTKLLKQGDNILDMTVGDGWYHGGTTKQTYKCFDDRHACLWQLEVTYADGSMETVCSDGEVKTASGPITASDLFHGESYDANIKIENWTPAVIADFGYDNLVPQDGEPVRPVITLPIKEIIRTPKDETILDLGQNIAGRLRAKINIPKGETVTFEHSETLDGQGNYFNN